MHLNYEHERLIRDNCKEMLILMDVTSIKNKIKRIVRAFIATTISSHSIIIILVRLRENTSLSNDCDLMFISY
jgi:predicted deacetylase